MSTQERSRRYILFVVGVIFNALGVSFLSRAALGTSPLSSLPFVLSLSTGISLGIYTLLFNTGFLILEALVRKQMTLHQLIQLPFTLLFSACIDLFMWLIPTQLNGPLPLKVLYLILGILLLALGISVEVAGGIVMLPGEAFVRAVSSRFNIPFHRVKICLDSCLTFCAVLLALYSFGRLNGVKQGTVVAALTVGHVVKFYTKKLGPTMERFCKGTL